MKKEAEREAIMLIYLMIGFIDTIIHISYGIIFKDGYKETIINCITHGMNVIHKLGWNISFKHACVLFMSGGIATLVLTWPWTIIKNVYNVYCKNKKSLNS